MKEWIDMLQSFPSDLPEIHFNHYYVMALTQQGMEMIKDKEFMRSKIEINPIRLEGKLFILKGLLESLDLLPNLSKLDLNVYVVHALNDCVFRSNNAELFMQTKFQQKNSLAKKQREKKGTRKLFYYQGGHDVATVNF